MYSGREGVGGKEKAPDRPIPQSLLWSSCPRRSAPRKAVCVSRINLQAITNIESATWDTGEGPQQGNVDLVLWGPEPGRYQPDLARVANQGLVRLPFREWYLPSSSDAKAGI